MKKHLPILASTLALYGCPEPNDPAIDVPDLAHNFDMGRLSDLNKDLTDQNEQSKN